MKTWILVASRVGFRSTSPLLVLLVACSAPAGKTDGTNSSAGQSGSTSSGASGGTSPGAGGAQATGGASGGSAQGGGGAAPSGADCPAEIGLPAAELLPNVAARVEGNTVRIKFDPRGNAKDYRVYVLPKAEDVSGDTIAGATYRCAGNYEVPTPRKDDPNSPGGAIITVINGNVEGYDRTLADSTLGYVFTTPGEDRIPVFALGDPALNSDNTQCYEPRFTESRIKTYTTSEEERSTLLDQHFRDDGIVFYVPKSDAAGTTPVYRAEDPSSQYDGPVYVNGAEYTARIGDSSKQITTAFSVYSAAMDGAEPLKRVFYGQACARSHDELVAGEGRFNKAVSQGGTPVLELHYSGLSEQATLVVEALDDLCPYAGVMSPESRPARDDPFGDFTISYPEFQTPDQLRAASASGELFVNGQGDGTTPHAVSRACVTVTPEPASNLDFHYDGTAEEHSAAEQVGFQIWTANTPTFDYQIHTIATDEWGIGSLFGELWLTYADWAADTNGKMRITPKTKGTLSADAFLYATMSVDIVSSDRRYPQLLISDQSAPVQDNLESGNTVVIQTRGGITSPLELQMQYCDHRTWDVNNQCPQWETYQMQDEAFLSPRPEINAFMASDATVKFEAYASTDHVYLYTNGLPYACVELPAGKFAPGPVSVTFGDVLYHSGVDLAAWYAYHVDKMQTFTSRHFSNLGFSSGNPRPDWDEARMPCSPADTLVVR